MQRWKKNGEEKTNQRWNMKRKRDQNDKLQLFEKERDRGKREREWGEERF